MKSKPISWSSDEEEETSNEPIRTSILRKGIGIIDFEAYNEIKVCCVLPDH